MKDLDKKQIKHLKAISHSLKPVVMLGQNGLSQAVLDEINYALEAHELIKVQIGGQDKSERQIIAKKISENTNSILVRTIGKQAVFYRGSEKNLIRFPGGL